jgi:hypothetical protein
MPITAVMAMRAAIATLRIAWLAVDMGLSFQEIT